MSKLKQAISNYHLDKLIWCLCTIAFCWTDVVDYPHATYNKQLLVWVVLGAFYCYKLGAYQKENKRLSVILTICGVAVLGILVGRRVVGFYYYYNYTIGVLSIVSFLLVGLIIKRCVRVNRMPRITLAGSCFLLLCLSTAWSINTNKYSYLFMVLILLPYACLELSKQEQKDALLGIVDGLCIGFIICQGYAFMFRSYRFDGYEDARYAAYCSDRTWAGMMMLLFFMAYLIKYVLLKKAGANKWYRRLVFVMAAFVVSLLYLTGSRGPVLGMITITAMVIAMLYQNEPWKRGICKWIQSCAVLAVLSFLLFPLAYAGVRYLPNVLNHPDLVDSEGNRLYSFSTVVLKENFLYNNEFNDFVPRAYDAWDSPKNISFAECLEGTLCRIVPGLDDILMPVLADDIFEAKVARSECYYELGCEGYAPEGYLLNKVKYYAWIYNQPLPEKYVELEQNLQSSRGKILLLSNATELSGLKRGDSPETPWFEPGTDFSDIDLRLAIHAWTWRKINLVGHDKDSYAMYPSSWHIVNPHNIFLNVGYYMGGIPMLFMFAAFIIMVIAPLRSYWKTKGLYQAIPALIVIGMTIFGWFETGFGYGNAYSILIYLCAMIWRKDERKVAD